MIDTHCHLTYKGLIEQVDQVVSRARAAGVERMITVGTTPGDAYRAVELADRYDGVFATVGLHPHYAGDGIEQWALEKAINQLVGHPKVVALGEMGLDCFYPEPPMDAQRQALRWQLEMAAQLEPLPIIIHNRQATDEVLTLLQESGIDPGRFVFHCFTGSAAELQCVLDYGAMVSFTGIVTFKNASSLAHCAAEVPLARLLVETDSPYLAPEPVRKARPNEPCHVLHVARFLATARGEAEGAFIRGVDDNAERFFGIGGSHQHVADSAERGQ